MTRQNVGAISDYRDMTDQPTHEVEDEALTWGVLEAEGHAVFAPTGLVGELRQLRKALSGATTWGEFRAQAPSRYVSEVEEMLDETPPDTDRFNSMDIPGHGDGDWPEWLQQVMLSWMPADLIARFGHVGESVFKEQALEIEAAVGEDLAQELETRGFTCARDDLAIRAAAGWA